MPKPPEGGELNEESLHLFQRALFVENVPYKVDPDIFPSNGHEYIQRVRMEQAKLFPDERKFYEESLPSFFDGPKEESDVEKKKIINLSKWKNKEAKFFSKLANQLKSNRRELMNKFSCSQKMPSIENEKDVCLFCLGSDLYQQIYKSDKVHKVEGHLPLLSIVLHISQEDIFTLLQYMTGWLMKTNFDHIVSRWVYALLACFQKPLLDEYEEFLENFYDLCVSRKKDCEKSEKKQIYLISSILENYFCVKSNECGTSFDDYVASY